MLNEIMAKNMIENYLNKNCIGEYYIVSIKSRLEQMDYEFKIFERNCYGQPNSYSLYINYDGIIVDTLRNLSN